MEHARKNEPDDEREELVDVPKPEQSEDVEGPSDSATDDFTQAVDAFNDADVPEDGIAGPFDTPPPEIIASAEPNTLPLLDELGNPPEMGTLHETLATWEAAASEFPGDPHFQTCATSKPREDLARIRRPFRPDVWLDRSNWTPVLAPDFQHSPQQLQQPLSGSSHTDASDADPGSALIGAALVVRIRDINKHFLDCARRTAPGDGRAHNLDH